MVHSFSNSQILAMSAAIPSNIVTMESLKKTFREEDVERISATTGFTSFRRLPPSSTLLDLACIASERIFDISSVSKKEIQSIVVVTNTPDFAIPQIGLRIHKHLQLESTVPCFDLNLGCSGFIFGLFQAQMMISSGVANNVLLVVGETQSKNLDPNDRSTQMIFGDAAAAVLVTKNENSNSFFNLKNTGVGHESIILPNSGSIKSSESSYLKINGGNLTHFVLSEVPIAVGELINFAKVQNSTINYFVFHQMNRLIIDRLVSKLSIEPAKSVFNAENIGNTGSSSIPLAICREFGKTQSVNSQSPDLSNILICGFGAGLSWGGAIIDLTCTQIQTPIEI